MRPGHPRRGRSIEKQHELNIDAQDAQDNQDQTLLHERLARAMIARGFVDAQDDKPAVSGKKSCASCASMLIKIMVGGTMSWGDAFP